MIDFEADQYSTVKEAASASVKDTLLLVLFFIIILLITLLALSILSITMFLTGIIAGGGIQLTLLISELPKIILDVLPFGIILSIVVLFVRQHRKPGIPGLSHLLIFACALLIWIFAFGFLDAKIDQTAGSEGQLRGTVSGTIQPYGDKRIYIHEAGTQQRGVYFTGEEEDTLEYVENLTALSGDIQSIPVRTINPVFAAVLRDCRIVRRYIFDAYNSGGLDFILLSGIILLFFVASSILLRISKFPLFILAVVILFFRFYFYAFGRFAAGSPGLILSHFLPVEISPPMLLTGYFAILLILITVRYHLVNRRPEPGETA